MRRAAPIVCALGLVAAPSSSEAAAGHATPVKVVSHAVVLNQAGVAPVAVRCRLARRSCRGVVTLGVPERNLPVGCPTCLAGVGSGNFRIGAGQTRTVAVRRVGPTDESFEADSWDVVALARLRTERLGMQARARRLRALRLEAPATLARPPVPLALVDIVSKWGLDQQRDDDALRFRVRAPRGVDAVRVEVRGRTLDLHPDMTFVVPEGSFAPGGTNFHGELPIAAGEYRYGERYPVRVSACQGDACQALATEAEVSPGAYGYGGPICRLPRADGTAGPVAARRHRRAAVHPSALAVLVAAPAAQ